MVRLVPAPWPEVKFEIADLNGKIENWDACWAVTLVHGSMLVFDFGTRVQIRTRNGGLIDVGTQTLSIRNVFWDLYSNGIQRMSSDQVYDEVFGGVKKLFVGQRLAKVEVDEFISLHFSGDVQLDLDRSDRYENGGEEIFELTFADGRIVQGFANGEAVQAAIMVSHADG